MIKQVKKFKQRFFDAIPTSTIVHRPAKKKTRAEIKQETKKEFMEWVQTHQQENVPTQGS